MIRAHDSRPVSLASWCRPRARSVLRSRRVEGRVTAVAKRTQSEAAQACGCRLADPVRIAKPSSRHSWRARGCRRPPAGGDQSEHVPRDSGAYRSSGFQGPYAPSGAASVDVPPESTATVSLEHGLAGEAAGIKLTSDVPVTGRRHLHQPAWRCENRSGHPVRCRPLDRDWGQRARHDQHRRQRVDHQQWRGLRCTDLFRGIQL